MAVSTPSRCGRCNDTPCKLLLKRERAEKKCPTKLHTQTGACVTQSSSWPFRSSRCTPSGSGAFQRGDALFFCPVKASFDRIDHLNSSRNRSRRAPPSSRVRQTHFPPQENPWQEGDFFVSPLENIRGATGCLQA